MKTRYILLTSVVITLSAPGQELEPSAPLGGRGGGSANAPTYSSRTPVTGQVKTDHRNVRSDAAPSTPIPAVNQDVLVAQWKDFAVKRYPALAEKGSPHNRAFLEVYEQLRKTDPEFFIKPDWPYRIAVRSISLLGSQPPAALVTEPASSASNTSPSLSKEEAKPEKAPVVARSEPATQSNAEDKQPQSQSGSWLQKTGEIAMDLFEEWLTQKVGGGRTPETAPGTIQGNGYYRP